MDDVAMQEALAHDQAAKAAAASAIPPEITQAPVSITLLSKQLDDKIAVLAKSVALGLLDVARQCIGIAMQPSEQRVIKDPKGGQRIEEKPPKAADAEKWIGVAAQAVGLAHDADVIGDRPLARAEPMKG